MRRVSGARTCIPVLLLMASLFMTGCAVSDRQPGSRQALPATGSTSGLEAYTENIRKAVRQHIVLPTNISGNPEVVVGVTQLPSGEVLAIRIVASSGSASLDSAVVRAVQKASPLPRPDDPALFRRDLIIKYRPFAE